MAFLFATYVVINKILFVQFLLVFDWVFEPTVF